MDLLLKLLQGTLSKSQSIPIYPTFSPYPLSVKPEVSQGFMQLARLFIKQSVRAQGQLFTCLCPLKFSTDLYCFI